MDVNRTFGVEIEMCASVDKEHMATLLAAALHEVGHTVRTSGYGHATSSSNTTVWMVEHDGSLHSTDIAHPHTMEVKTPVLKGVDGLKALKIACTVLSTVGSINKSCGLHVHHFINPNERSQHLRNLINAWIDNERHFMSCVPPSRQSNSYCAKWGSPPKCNNVTDPRDWFNHNTNGRKCTLNLNSIGLRGTVEFRMHSGTYEFEKISNWLIATQRFIIKAMRGDFIYQKANTFDEFIGHMEVDLDIGTAPPIRRHVETTPPTAGSPTTLSKALIHPDASKKKLPKPGTKAHTIATMLLRGATKEELMEALDTEHGHIGKAKQLKFVSGQLTNMKNPKYSWGFRIQKNSRTGKFRIAYHDGAEVDFAPQQETQEQVVRPLRIASKLDLRSLHWLKGRREFFGAQRASERRARNQPRETDSRGLTSLFGVEDE